MRFLLILLIPVLLKAGEIKEMSPEELGLIALKKSEQVTAAELEILSKKGFLNQAGSYKNPNVSLSVGRRIDNGIEGPAYQVGISQPLFYPGKRKLRERTKEEELNLEKENLKQQKLNIYYDVLLLTYDYYIAIQREEHARKRMERFKILDSFFRTRPFASPRRKLSKIIVANRLRILRAELTGIQNEKQIAWKRLNIYLSFKRKIQPNVGLFKFSPSVDFDSLLSSSLKNSPNLKELEANVRKNSLLAKLSRKEAYPDISLNGYYSRQEGGGKEINFGAGVSMPIPVLNRYKGQAKGYESKSLSLIQELKFEKRKLIQEFDTYKSRLKTAEKKIEYLPPSLMEKAHKELRYADNSFRQGLINFVEFLNAEEEHDLIHEGVLEAHREYAMLRIKLYYLSGEILSVFPKGAFDV